MVVFHISGEARRVLRVTDAASPSATANRRQPQGLRVNDVVLSSDGSRLVMISGERKIHVLDVLAMRIFPDGDAAPTDPMAAATSGLDSAAAGGTDVPGDPAVSTAVAELVVTEVHAVTSVTLSRCGRYLLSRLSSQAIHLHDLGDTPLVRCNAAARGQPAARAADSWVAPLCTFSARPGAESQGRYVLRPCFGGTCEELVASGGEDGLVYLWSRVTGVLLSALPGHAGSVNAVAWCPATPHLFASASDDSTVRLWV